MIYMLSGSYARCALFHGFQRTPIGKHEIYSDAASTLLALWVFAMFLETVGDKYDKLHFSIIQTPNYVFES